MKVILTHPYCWPYVRRGSERNIEVWRHELARRGHDVKLISTIAPDAQPLDDPQMVLSRYLWKPFMGRFRLQPTHTFFFTVLNTLKKMEADVVHAFHYSDALAATIAAQGGRRFRTILQMNGVHVPGVSCRRWLPPEAKMIRGALERVDSRVSCSSFVRDLCREHYGLDTEILVPPLDRNLWPYGQVPRADPPVVLAAGNFNERRKGVRVLIRGFQLLRREMPEARLRISGTLHEAIQTEILTGLPADDRAAIEILGLGKPEDLPILYQSASVLVLPSMWEPSGTVMMEAWLSGTPVVATRHGGLPEFFAPDVGEMFDPLTNAEETSNAEGLAQAMFNVIQMAQQPETRERCRAHGERFSLETAGPPYETLYRRLVDAR